MYSKSALFLPSPASEERPSKLAKKLAKRWRDSADVEAREEMVRLIWPWANSFGAKLVQYYPDIDAAEHISFAILDAVDTYNPAKGSLSAWAAWYLRHYLRGRSQAPMLSGHGARKLRRDVDYDLLSLTTKEGEFTSDMCVSVRKLLAWLRGNAEPWAVVTFRWALGETSKSIGASLKLSKQRIHQLKDYGLRRLRVALQDGIDSELTEEEIIGVMQERASIEEKKRRSPPWLRCARRLRELLRGREMTLAEARARLPKALAAWASRAVVARPMWFQKIETGGVPKWRAISD